jgi:hypothetical protein
MTKFEILNMKKNLQSLSYELENAKKGQVHPQTLRASMMLPWPVIIPAIVQIVTALIPLFMKLLDNQKPSDEDQCKKSDLGDTVEG